MNPLGSEEALRGLHQSAGESQPQLLGGSAQLQLQSAGQGQHRLLQGTAQLEVSHSTDESKSRCQWHGLSTVRWAERESRITVHSLLPGDDCSHSKQQSS